jgi:drug/metabolite transporter (DMT)-like permease
MAKTLTILLTAILFEAIGVVYLSRGLKEIGELQRVTVAAVLQLVGRGVTNFNIIRGVFFEALFFIGLLMLLSKYDVSMVWPLTALSFVATTLAAKFVLHEEISAVRWAGVVLITCGAGLVSWTEKAKSPPPKPAAVAQILVPPER